MFFETEGLDHQGYCIRPPSEAYSILLQATLGCSHNKCTFCDAFKAKRFAIKDRAIWEKDIEFASRYCRRQDRVFVMDGDAFVMPMRHWEWLLTAIATRLPWVTRIGTYANAKGVALKTDDELRRLRELGLSMIYYGVESGHPDVLRKVHKGADPEKLLTQARRLKDAGFTLSVTVIVGLAGREGSLEHAKATGDLLTKIDPDYVGALTLMLPPGAPISGEVREGTLELPGQMELLAELGVMFSHTTLTQGMFTANHASNYLPIRAHLPQDKEKVMALIRSALDGKIALRQEWMRAL
ncbi:Radical SAM domain protein [uncultured delta proteobacterium]|uniref:Radical SAM domain protein n=1 Tax=uncultured delta proteobacterium TaxID=34034 RepID=A0A212J645_9DELT|nr:Radical SAM domain protein [uncultured delta proteobacterium]